jgi:hypothetical protein
MTRHKDQGKKMRVKSSAVERGPVKNDQEFTRIIAELARQKKLPADKRDRDAIIICRVENMEGNGMFHLFSKEAREYFAGCPGNMVLASMIGQLVKEKIHDIEQQPLVLMLIDERSINPPEILALITDPEEGKVTRDRMKALDDLAIKFIVKEESFEFEEEVNVDTL